MPRLARMTTRAMKTEAEVVAMAHGGGGFGLDNLVHEVLLVSVFARMREARPARQRVVWASWPAPPGWAALH